MKLSSLAKDSIFALVSIFCLVVSIYLHILGVVAFYYTIILAILTILIPLCSALYFYKDKQAKVFMFLTIIAVLCTFVFSLDAIASIQGFKNICSNLGVGHEFVMQADSYVCTAPAEADYIVGDIFSSSLSGATLYVYFLVVLFSVGHLLYLTARLFWAKIRRNRTRPTD